MNTQYRLCWKLHAINRNSIRSFWKEMNEFLSAVWLELLTYLVHTYKKCLDQSCGSKQNILNLIRAVGRIEDPEGRLVSNVVGICFPVWNRVNVSAKIWGPSAPHHPGSDGPESIWTLPCAHLQYVVYILDEENVLFYVRSISLQ